MRQRKTWRSASRGCRSAGTAPTATSAIRWITSARKAALALKDGGRLPVAIMGDGDFLMGATALWTAAHYGIPCLILVANNRSFFNDELHQERVAKERSRPVENRWIGQRIK